MKIPIPNNKIISPNSYSKYVPRKVLNIGLTIKLVHRILPFTLSLGVSIGKMGPMLLIHLVFTGVIENTQHVCPIYTRAQ